MRVFPSMRIPSNILPHIPGPRPSEKQPASNGLFETVRRAYEAGQQGSEASPMDPQDTYEPSEALREYEQRERRLRSRGRKFYPPPLSGVYVAS